MKKGFTLVEMLAIIVILGVLGTIGVVTFNNTQNKSKQKLYAEQLNNIEIALRRYITENEGRTIDIYGTSTKLDIFTFKHFWTLFEVCLLSSWQDSFYEI